MNLIEEFEMTKIKIFEKKLLKTELGSFNTWDGNYYHRNDNYYHCDVEYY